MRTPLKKVPITGILQPAHDNASIELLVVKEAN